MKMYVARDKDNSLSLYSVKPVRNTVEDYWKTNQPLSIIKIDETHFPNLTWEMESQEIEIQLLEPDKIESVQE